MNDLSQLEQVRVRLSDLVAAYRHFRDMGRQGCEGVALWVGRISDSNFEVTETVIPKQKGIRSDDGLAYVVEEAELRRLNVWLYEQNLRLIAQLHSHPAAAYHSETDDLYPIMTTVGGLSIVVPDFAAGPPDIEQCATYRLDQNGWTELSTAETSKLIEIV